jgi:hypothetical protein
VLWRKFQVVELKVESSAVRHPVESPFGLVAQVNGWQEIIFVSLFLFTL